MKHWLPSLIFGALAFAPSLTSAQATATPSDAQIASEPVPAGLAASAVEAVRNLGQEVTKGNYQVAIDRMNPMWKERLAKRNGGMENLESQLAEVPRELVRQGITMLSHQPTGQPAVYEVWPGKKTVNEGGKSVEKLVYTKWLVLVPTVSRFRILREGDPKALLIDSTSFQAAIRDKSDTEWSFIDGSTLTSADLRSLFITLPRDMELPPIGKKEVR